MKNDILSKEQKFLIAEIVESLSAIIENRYTNGHSKRVAKYTAMLTKELGYNDETIFKYYNIALLHDIGKIGIPKDILNKPGKLTAKEYEIIKTHTIKGYDILKNVHLLPELAIGAKTHHERPDGKGYPMGLKEESIPRYSQIISVADAFDAMNSNRPYRNRLDFETTVSIIKNASGSQFCCDVVDAFLRLVKRGELNEYKQD